MNLSNQFDEFCALECHFMLWVDKQVRGGIGDVIRVDRGDEGLVFSAAIQGEVVEA